MAGVITTANTPKAIWPGVKTWFGRGYDETTPEWMPLFDKVTSNKQYEEYVSITGFGGAAVKTEGTGVEYDSELQGFVTRLVNVAYALGYIVTKEEIADNLYAKIAQTRGQALGFSFRQTKELIGANIYNRAFNPTYLGGDGQTLSSTAHPLIAGGTFSNTLAVGADMSEASLEDLLIQIMGTVDDRGLTINLMPKMLIVPKNEIFNAQRILKSTMQSATANNDINAINNMNVFSDGIKVNRYLTSPHAWFVRTEMPVGQGMIYQERVGIEFTSDNDFDTENAKYKAYERYAFGWADPRAIFSSNGP